MFHACWKYVSYIQDLEEIIRRIFRIVRHASFPTFSNLDFQYVYISKNIISQEDSGFFLNSFESFGFSKVQNNWFRESWSRPLGPRTIKMKGFQVLPKWNRKVISRKWSRIISRSFWAILLLKFTVSMAPQTPNPELSRIFPGGEDALWHVHLCNICDDSGCSRRCFASCVAVLSSHRLDSRSAPETGQWCQNRIYRVQYSGKQAKNADVHDFTIAMSIMYPRIIFDLRRRPRNVFCY